MADLRVVAAKAVLEILRRKLGGMVNKSDLGELAEDVVNGVLGTEEFERKSETKPAPRKKAAPKAEKAS